tara:strand:- start:2490 stop:3176 length:687 start_codon:yes stop_codon:yes gene_type:complete
MSKLNELKRLLTVLCVGLALFSCVNEKKEIETVLALDEEHSIVKNGISLIPILNQVAEKQLKLKSDSQEGDMLKLEFEIDLEGDEELHYSINNGNVSIVKEELLELDLLEGNNVIFVCLSNSNGVSSSFWVKNYYIGDGEGSFEASQPHLFQNLITKEEGIVVDYQIMNESEDASVAMQIDSLSFTLAPNATYLLKRNTPLRLQLFDLDGEPIDGPFNDTGLIGLYEE